MCLMKLKQYLESVGNGWMGLENEIVGRRQETRDIHSSEGTFIPCGQSTTVNNITSAFNM